MVINRNVNILAAPNSWDIDQQISPKVSLVIYPRMVSKIPTNKLDSYIASLSYKGSLK